MYSTYEQYYTFKRLSRWYSLTTHDSRLTTLSLQYPLFLAQNEERTNKKTPSVQPNIPFCLSAKRPHAKDSASQNWKRGVRRFLRRKGSTSNIVFPPRRERQRRTTAKRQTKEEATNIITTMHTTSFSHNQHTSHSITTHTIFRYYSLSNKIN